MASRRRRPAVALVVVVAGLAGASPAGATNIHVTSEYDVRANDGRCTLREAVDAANTNLPSGPSTGECAAGNGADTILVPAGFYRVSGPTLTGDTSDLVLLDTVTIAGAGADQTVISGDRQGRVFAVDQGATLKDVTITGGHAADGGEGLPGASGGGIENFGDLTLQSVVVSGNSAGDGGAGSFAQGANAQFTDSGPGKAGGKATAQPGSPGGSGGGIYNGGVLTVRDGVIRDNQAGRGGAGGRAIGGGGGSSFNDRGGSGGAATGGKGGPGGSGGAIAGPGSLTVVNSVIAENAAGAGGVGGGATGGNGGGGGFTAQSTGGDGGAAVSGNAGIGGDGGGIATTGAATITGTTVSGNTAGAGGAGGLVATGGRAGHGSTDGSATGGVGGPALGAAGAPGGGGGGIWSAGGLTLAASTVTANSTGPGGDGGAAIGGNGGSGAPPNGNGQVAGTGAGGSGGAGGAAGGVAAANASVLVNVTITLNTSDRGGAAGPGTGGTGGAGAGTGRGGDGGFGVGGGGGGGGFAAGLTAGRTVILHASISANAAGTGGLGGSALAGPGGAGGPNGGSPGAAGTALPGAIGPTGVGAISGGSTTTLRNSIVASNPGGNCSVPVVNGGHDVSFGDATCPGTNADPQLGPLADNGGPTRTRALGAASAARNLVPATGAGCAAADQRGVPRPQGPACDAGAYEAAPPGVVTQPPTAVTPSAAVLRGIVDPHLQKTTYHFEWRLAGSGRRVSTPAHVTPAVEGRVDVSAALSGLAPGTAYAFRLVASSGDGTSMTPDAPFTTAPASAAPEVLPALVPAQGAPSAGRGASLLPVDSTPPAFLAAWMRPAVIRVGRAATLRFRLSESGRVAVAVERLAGRSTGRTRAARHAWVAVGRVGRAVPSGTSSLRFPARVHGRGMSPGRYRATLIATDAAGNASAPRRLRWTIVAPG